MTKKTRLIILLVCIICFFVGVPYIVLYSQGYRIDFSKMKIIATGGIYVRTFPAADQIVIDSHDVEKPSIFTNYIFVQNLLPQNHSILITKSGYYSYSKTLPVQEKEVTKLENVSLFKKDLAFQTITTPTQNPFLIQAQQEKFIIKNNNLYFSATPQNTNLTTLQKNTPVIKNLVAFTVSNNNILWLGTDGFLYQSDLAGLPAQAGKSFAKSTATPLKIIKKNTYKIIVYGQTTFVNNNGNLMLLDTATNSFKPFATNVTDAKISPDGLNIVYYTKNEIYISLIADPLQKKVLLYKSSDVITDIQWLNNSYIIFVAGNKITISEIDYRGNNINTVTLNGNYESPKIIFNSQQNILYISSGNTILSSANLMP